MNSTSLHPAAPEERGPAMLVEALLLEQSDLSAADRFSQRHESHEFPARAKYYRDLIPLTRPASGEQYAFRVDLDSCSGCKACVAACHELNGLEDEETWREVGLLVGSTAAFPILQHVTSACHHCVEPGCLAGCPVRAYEKDEHTGIVRHLDDQCIGCQYCIWTCPYEVPKFSESKGIVRKCDMCRQRLEADEAPACVQSCPNQAIAIEIVRQEEAQLRAARGEFVSVICDGATSVETATTTTETLSSFAPDPRITVPTTRYVTRRHGIAFANSADHQLDVLQHAHWPLIVMLVLTQLSVGLLLVERVIALSMYLRGESALWASTRFSMSLGSLSVAILGVAVANFHLGRPQVAFRAILGWRTSWLSREVLAFGIMLASTSLYVAVLWLQPALPQWVIELCGTVATVVAVAAACTSAMVYVGTKREVWRARVVFSEFGFSVLLLGLSTSLLLLWLSSEHGRAVGATQGFVERALLLTTATLSGVRLLLVRRKLNRSDDSSDSKEQTLAIETRIARLFKGHLGHLANLRLTFGMLSAVIFPSVVLASPWIAAQFGVAVPLALQLSVLVGVVIVRIVAETLERYLFFVTALSSKMPGGMP